jgi:hypothetical protein
MIRASRALCGADSLHAPQERRWTTEVMTYIALGVNIGNISREKRVREPMQSRCQRINQSLTEKGIDLRVTGFFRHTGNLVIETGSQQPAQAATILAEIDGAIWTAVSEATMRSAVGKTRKLLPPESEKGVRWTPGLAFAVTKPYGQSIASSEKVRLRLIDSGTVAAWKRDRITERGQLDRKMRDGGWGAVSRIVAEQTNSQWTARSLTTLEGVLDRPTQVRE